MPIENPVYIFAIVLSVFFFAPRITRHFRIPGIVGLICAGVLLGPNGLNILALDSSILLFGTVGMLYIMFLSGLGVNFTDFKQAGKRSLIFGLLTFAVPQGLGTIVGIFVLNQSWAAAILLASMYASHTLLAYPIASRLGLKRSESVVVAVGGTLITNFIALSVLAIIAASVGGDLTYIFWLRISSAYLLFIVIMFFIMPIAAKWLFRRIESEGGAQFLLVLAWVFISASLAQLLGIEPIIGAFFAGLVINRFVLQGAPLQNRIEFIGNNLFIPYFLIYVGMIVDLRVFLGGGRSLLVAFTLTVTATSTKWLAAYFTQRILKYTTAQRNLLFGLSNAQAANTLAAVLIGFNLGLLSEDVLNGTIVMILVTCIISAFVVENQGRAVALQEESRKDNGLGVIHPDKVLIPIANPATVPRLIDLAHLLKKENKDTLVYPLTIVNDTEGIESKLSRARKMLNDINDHAGGADALAKVITRVDINVAGGIIRTAKEKNATKVILGWSSDGRAVKYIFGSVVDNLLDECEPMIVVGNLLAPLNSVTKVRLILPQFAEKESGFYDCLVAWTNLVDRLCLPAEVYGVNKTVKLAKDHFEMSGIKLQISYHSEKTWREVWRDYRQDVGQNELLTILSARPGSISWDDSQSKIPSYIVNKMPKNSFVIFYPHKTNENNIW